MANKKQPKSKAAEAQALREFRSKVAKLKAKGIVSAKVDARSQKATKYMRAKVRKFEDVLSGEAIAVKAKKAVREKYTSAGVFGERGSFLIVPKEHKNSRARIKKGRDLVEIVTPLKYGEEREVVLPFKASNMLDLAQKLEANPIDDLKKGDEQFAFRLFGHNSRKAFVDNGEFVDHVLRNYRHLFSGKSGGQAIKHLSIIKFKGPVEAIPPAPEDGKIYDKPRRIDADGKNRGRKGTYERQRDKARARKKAERRAKETPEQKQTRLEKQRAYDAKHKAERKARDKKD